MAYLFVVLGIMAGCAQKTADLEQESAMGGEPVRGLSIEEQNKAAYDILKQILVLSDSPERQQKLPEIKALYREIIVNYPDIGLAQESYMRLVIMAKEEKTPEGDAEAERVYQEFLQKYPDSRLQRIIESELNRK